MAGLGRSKFTVGTMVRSRNISADLMTPATPAAASRCPTFDFTDPMAQNPLRSVFRRNASVSADTSTGSPSRVAVPWASTWPIEDGSTPATACASAMTATCPSFPGAA